MGEVINIIYDNRHTPQDYERLIKEFSEQTEVPEYKFWDAIVLKDSVVKSINASHKMIVRWAKDNNMKQVTIAEQDMSFTSTNAWRYYLDNMPDEFDLYLWGTYVLPMSNKKICGFQLYTIAEKFYDTFLDVPEALHIDTAMDDLGGDYKLCYPFVALQRPGFSANHPGDHVNYNVGIKDYIYKG